MLILVRHIDETIWRNFAGICKMQNILIGEKINQLLIEYIKKVKDEGEAIWQSAKKLDIVQD